MANTSLDLAKLTSVGVYLKERVVPTAPIIVDTNQVRIIAGFSKKGPKNTLVYVSDSSEAIQIYGDIDYSLEKKGSYFHRSLLTALETGPVFALNLLPVNNDASTGDKIEFISYSINTAAKNGFTDENGNKLNHLYSAFFNKERFWKPDEDYFQGIVDSYTLSKNKYFSITKLDEKPVTILTRKSQNPPRDFSLTVSEFFGKGEEPSMCKPYDYVSDYFVDVTLISGKWDDFSTLANDPIFGTYFNTNGLIKSRVDAFLANESVTILGGYTGAIIPELLDNSGENYSIDAQMNVDYLKTGVFCTLNDEALNDYDADASLEHIDLVGHNLVAGLTNRVDYLSYNQIIDNLSIIIRETDRFKFSSEDESLITAHDLGYEIAELLTVDSTETINGEPKYTKLNLKQISVDIDLSSVSFADDNLYVDLGNDYWLWGAVTDNTISGYLADNTNNKLLYLADEYKLKETSIRMTDDGSDFKIYFNDEDLIAFDDSGVENSDWYAEVSGTQTFTNSGAGYDLYILDTSSDPELKKISFSSPTVSRVAGSGSDWDYTITLSNVTLGGSSLAAGDYQVVIEPTAFTSDVDVYSDRQDAIIVSEGGDNLLILGPENLSYANTEDITDENQWAALYSAYLTDGEFKINDSGTDYKLLRVDSLDGALILKDTLVDDGSEQGTEFEFTLNSDGDYTIKLDLTDSEKIYTEYDIERIHATDNTKVYVDGTVGALINIDDYLVATYDGNDVLTIVQDKIKYISSVDGSVEYEIKTVLPIKVTNSKITKYFKIDDFVDQYKLHSLGGFTFTSYHLPNGTDTQMKKIYDVLDPSNSNLRAILSERNILNWRYIVDTFSGGIAPNMGGKVQLSLLAKDKAQGMSIVNAPSFNQFADSTNPLFTDAATALNPKPILNTDYIKAGGNLSLGPSNKFTVPNIENGGDHSIFLSNYLTIFENNKQKLIPPAADVSNNYIRAFNSGQQYDIVAGDPLGIIANSSVTGVEYDLLDADRANLESIGLTPIVNRGGNIMVYANLTGHQRIVTPTNKAHVRNLLISIENALLDLTERFLFRKNTPTVRLDIQTQIEAYLEGVLTQGGIEWFEVVVDSSNNTSEVINQSAAIADVAIIPTFGIEKFLNRLTVYGAGGSNATGFTN